MASLLMVSMNFPRLHSSARLAYLSLRLSASLRPDLPSVPKPPDPPEPPDPPDLPSFQICVVLASLLTSSPLNITHLLSPPLTAAHRVLPSVFIPHRVKDPEAHLHLSLVKATPVAKYPPPRSLDPFSPLKRNGYLSWDDYFMAIAFLSAERSKDPNRQVGACLVSQNCVIMGIGYNGFPRGCSDDKLPWAKVLRSSDIQECLHKLSTKTH
ncbi:unnamed protein product [Arabidopsis halleri]